MRLVTLATLLLAACATTGGSGYVPGGAGLPDEARAAYGRAVQRERNGDDTAALAILDELCSRHPLRLGFHLHRIRLARRLLGPEAAAALYEPPPPGVGPERAGVLATLARLETNDLAGRKSILGFAAEREPDQALWRLAIADVELQAHEAVVARAELERELGRTQSAAESVVEARQILAGARADAERAFELDPGLADAQVVLGYLWTREADLAEGVEERDAARKKAEEHYLGALEIDRDHLTALVNLAENYLYFDRLDSAGRMLRRASALAPTDPLVWNNLGVRYHGVGQIDAAIECYEQALRFDEKNARVRTALSDCLRRRGDSAEAVAQLVRAREDAGGDRGLLAEIAFKLGAIHEHEARYREAVEEYERHIALGGDDAAKARSRIRAIYSGAFE